MLQRQVQVLQAAGAQKVFVAGGDGAPPGAQWVPDHPAAEGPLAGVLGAYKHLEHPYLAVLAVDMPKVTDAWIRYLRAHTTLGKGLVVRTASGLEPLAAFYPACERDSLLRWAESGQGSLRTWLDIAVAEGRFQALQPSPEIDSMLESCNTPEDASRLGLTLPTFALAGGGKG